MKTLLRTRFVVQFVCLVFVIALMSFKRTSSSPSFIVGSFSQPYSNLSSVCDYPLEYVVCNNDPNTNYNLLRVKFLGNNQEPQWAQITSVSGGTNVQSVGNNQVKLNLPAGECATIIVNAKYEQSEQNIQAYLDNEYDESVNVVYDQTAQSNCP